ncbi:MAG: hypothetical protein A2V88_08670 [Elusimicrobia bacterium RBG_16_66_12]|nr:MAG: hypothetical protein A2V88_08670 [Elusimicrobia bacterium RBG_16_66_12]
MSEPLPAWNLRTPLSHCAIGVVFYGGDGHRRMRRLTGLSDGEIETVLRELRGEKRRRREQRAIARRLARQT